MEELKKWIEEAKNIVFFTGAGISTESGIPDFRSSGGFWKEGENREYYISKYYFERNPKDFWKKYKDIFELKLMGNYKPNTGHLFIKELEEKGKNITILTQNVDGLHQKAGNQHIIELHGTLQSATCPKCKTKYDIRFINQHEIPRCAKENAKGKKCDFILKPDVVLFGDQIQGYKEAEKAIDQTKLFIVMGTSLEVYPVNNFPKYAKLDWETKIVLINKTPTSMDQEFHKVIYGGIGEIIEKIKN